MNLSCTKENLLAGLNTVSRIASKNLTLPILGNVLVRAEGGTISLSATNLEVGVVATVRGKIIEAGSITIQARLLLDYIGLLDSDKVELVSDGASLKVSSANSETVIRGNAADDFPIIPSVAREHGIKVSGPTLRGALAQVLFAAAQDTSRPEISGVHLTVEKKSLVLAATDSYRLAERTIEISGGSDRNMIIPTRPLVELTRILPADGEVEMFFSDSQVLVAADGIELTTRLIEGQYPDYQQIVPTSSSTTATIEIESLTKLVKTASLFCKPGINDVTIAIDPDAKSINCAAANTELGEHHGNMKAAITGPACTIVFNYKYLLDGLSNIGTTNVTLGVTDSGSPGVLRPSPAADYFYLIMPIRQ
ncbi:MAG: DNA polymerase III subunit beta [Candidatus Kerfeldbacteria bacterium]|nr:DNA polymerase III subunit beta [Candidatus Kerfeldbacteria bacterium]